MKPPLDFKTFFSQFPVRIYKKHWPLVNAGDNVQKIYYIKKGYIRLYSISSEGKELTLIIYKPGEFFPLVIAFEPSMPFRYWVETMIQAEIVAVPIESFRLFFRKNPKLLLDLAVKVMMRLDRILRRLESSLFGNAYQKVASIFIIFAEAFGKEEENKIVIQAPLTHKDIATTVGMTRETVSIEIKKLERKGIIGYRGRQIIIRNIHKLKKESLFESEE